MTGDRSMWRHARRERVREVMDRLGLGAVVLRTFPNFAWYTGGADNRVDHSSPAGVADVVVTVDAEYVLTNNIEAPRIRDEETPDIEVVEYPWFEDGASTLRDLAGGNAIGSDLPRHDVMDVSGEIVGLRYVLDPDALERYRQVGAATATAMAEVAAGLTSGMGEDEVSGMLLAACRARGMYAPVVMAAGAKRLTRYRHAIPQPAPIEGRVMLVLCAEKGGVYANLTRFVFFEEPDAELARRFRSCATILEQMRQVTTPGRTLADVFHECQRFYAEEGFRGEWRMHHQGGMTGYATREIVATADTLQEIQSGQAFAWNPSITGAKAEETFILTEGGPQVITVALPSGG